MRLNNIQLKRAVSVVLFFVLISAVGLTKAFTQSFTVGKLNYSINSDGVSVTVTGPVHGQATGELVIPETVTYDESTYSVTTIGDYAFYYCSGFTGSLIIPNSVTTIGEAAFYYCSGFTGNLVIPNSVNTISAHAFRNCTNFSSVEYNATDCADVDVTMPPFEHCGGTLTIGENVERIPANMFKWAAFTGSLIIPNSMTIIGDDAFYSCSGFTGDLVIHSSMTYIGAYAFSGCTGFSSVEYNATDCADTWGPFLNCGGTLTIGENVERIPAHMFYLAAFTGSLIIPNSVTAIGDGAFGACYRFTGNLVIPNSVTTIGYHAFYNCTGFSSVEYNATDCADASVHSPFEHCGGTLTIGENVERIPDNMFCSAAFSLILCHAEMPPIVGTDAFYGIDHDIPVYVPCVSLNDYQNAWGWKAFTNILGNSFEITVGDLNYSINCDETTVTVTGHVNGTAATGELLIPETVTYNESTYSVTAIGNDAFSNCTGLTGNLVIPNSVTTIEEWAFYGCTGFTGTLVIPNSVNTISAYAFRNCTNFFAVEYNATDCADASEYPFLNCGGTLTIGENVERIPANMFEDAAFTGSLIIPNSVTAIGDGAFGACYRFTGDLVISNSVNTISAYAFRSCTNFSSVEYNATDCADLSSGSPFLDCGGTLIIGENVEHIPARMFSNAAFTGSLIIPNSVTSIGEWAFYNCTGFTGNLVIPNSVNTISAYAFRSCTNFSSVEYNATDCADLSSGSPFLDCGGTLIIGENVEHIPARMFSNAAFTLILSYAEIPPTVGIYAFYGIDHDIPVYVPCGSLSDYQNADGWKEFNNIFECFEVKEITAAVTPANSGTVTGAGTYEIGTTCTLTAIANEGWSFYSWTEDGDGVSNNPEYSFMVTGNRNLVANFIAEGSLCSLTIEMYDSWGDGWNGGKLTVSDDFGGYNKVTLSGGLSGSTTLLVPDGSHITLGWINGDYDSECSFNVRYANGDLIYHGEDMSSDFSFEFDMDCPATMFTITATANPAEGGTIIGSGTYNHGATATLTATANTGHTFINWTKDGTVVSTNPTYSFTVTEDASYVANFELNSYTITATANPTEGGIVTGAGTYNHSCTCTLTAMANPDHTFINWTKDGTVVSTNQIYIFIVTEDASYVADFELNSYTITATANPIEGGTVIGAGTYNHGATATLMTAANTNYTFINWTKNGTIVSAYPTYSFIVTEDASYVANFELSSYTITATANPVEGGTVTGAGTYNHGATATLTATANTGYAFISWAKNYTVVSTEQTYSFTVTEDASYVANFELNSYTITATANPIEGGTIIGAGTYTHGATATLMAAANTGYAFIKWTKDGTVVSTDPTYSFTVTEDVDLVANFKLPGDANGDGIVDALDIVVIVNHIFGLPTEEFVFDNADVNGDGVVDALDIVIIVNIIFSKKNSSSAI